MCKKKTLNLCSYGIYQKKKYCKKKLLKYLLLNPFTPRISFVVLLTVCHTILITLVWRIWY